MNGQFKPCPDCDYDELEWREVTIEGTYMGDADVERIYCRNCESWFDEHELCRQCGKMIPMNWQPYAKTCSKQCSKEYHNG